MTRDMGLRWLVVGALITSSFACTPGSGGRARLEGRAGRVVDQASGQGLAHASVYQVWWGQGVAGEPRPAQVLRWVEADSHGEFDFPDSKSEEPRGWSRLSGSPEYGFFHSDYGLVRAGTGTGDSVLVLTGRMLDEAGRRASELNLCGAKPADEVLAGVAAMHCGRGR